MSSGHKIDSQILIYQSSEGNIKVDVHLEDKTVWLTQEQVSLFFGKVKSMLNMHNKNVFSKGELHEAEVMKKFRISEFQFNVSNYCNSVVRKYRITASDSKGYKGDYFNLVVCRNFRHTTQHGAIEGKTQTKKVKHLLHSHAPRGNAYDSD